MSEQHHERHFTQCADIEPVKLLDEEMEFDKVPDQTPFTTFVNWARHEARKLCKDGVCSKGTCKGHVDLTEWKVLEETDDRFKCLFTAEFYCRCE